MISLADESTVGAMPKTGKNDHARKDELPSTLQRSDQKAQDTFAKTYDSAMESYNNDESRAARAAYASLKHSYEKVGDHWEPKEKRGPSDERAEKGLGAAEPTAGGVDANASKKHLMERARELNISGRSAMDKEELVRALQKANDAATRKARGR
ncbi:ChaB protein [Arthrobacter sp. SLBN-100]|nr:ChaB protein [Arthrobacter sp. SLBN-100]